MKSFPLVLLFATYAAVSSSQAQAPSPAGNATDDVVNSMSPIKRPTPRPSSTSTTTKTPTVAGPKKPVEASLTTDDKGKGSMTAFDAATPKIYLHWDDETATKGDKLRVVWIAEDAVGFSKKNKQLTEASVVLPGPGANGNFYLPAAQGGFPVGKYRADLYEGTKLAKSLKFTVKK